MTTERDLDRILATWLSEGTERAHAEDVAAALRRVERTRQGRVYSGWRAGAVLPSTSGRSWLVAALVMAASVGVWTAVGGASGRVVSASIDASDFPWAAAVPAVDAVAFVATLPADAPVGSYWRAATYDRFELDRWTQSDVELNSVPSGQPLLGASNDAPLDDQTVAFTVSVQPEDYRGGLLLSPGMPVRVDADARVRLIGSHGGLAGVEVPAGSAYSVEARTLRLDDPTVISGDLLRQASQAYPVELVERYTAVSPGALGPEARRLLAAILASTPSHDPYDLALAAEAYLKDPGHFRYRTDLSGIPCAGESVVECFARTRTGFCLHYATTMAILLRAALPADPIPTRLVQGFLPGPRSNGTEIVATRLAHAWVEVYFNGYGWIPFDPTGGGVGRRSPFPAPTRLP